MAKVEGAIWNQEILSGLIFLRRHTCGILWSCMACYYDTRPGGIGFGLFDAIAYQSHGWFEHLAILLGRPLNKVPFPEIVYNILHGNNAYEGRRKPPKLRSSI